MKPQDDKIEREAKTLSYAGLTMKFRSVFFILNMSFKSNEIHVYFLSLFYTFNKSKITSIVQIGHFWANLRDL